MTALTANPAFATDRKDMQAMRPIIGVLADVDDECSAKVKSPYIRAMEACGATPILLPYVDDGEVVARFAELCNGFLFTGGADIDPKRYGEEPRESIGSIRPYRDQFEFYMLQKVIKT